MMKDPCHTIVPACLPAGLYLLNTNSIIYKNFYIDKKIIYCIE